MPDHAYRATIAPVGGGEPRPFWSVMIPTYDSGPYLRRTLKSVLAQAPGPERMQIEVVDDCSTRDDPESVVREVGGERVGFFRRPSNGGHVATFNECLARSRGDWVHVLHGDDQVRPGFYAAMERGISASADIGAAFCRHITMDERDHWGVVGPLLRAESGVLDGWLDEIAAGQRLQAVAVVVRRSVYEALGGYDRRIHYYGEDWEMWVRIAAHYPVWYETEPLALYRTHTDSLTGRSSRTGANIRDIAQAIEINRRVLPPAREAQITRQARVHNALAALRRAHRMLWADDFRAPLYQLREALRLAPTTPKVLARGALLASHWAVAGLRRAVLRK